MIAALLAAGVGNRLGADSPKALLEVGGRTLLDRHLDAFERLGLTPLVVTGFRADLFSGLPTVHNPRYRDGSILSFRAALDAVDDDVVVMDADVVYDRSILADVVALERGFALDPRSEFTDEEMMLGVRDGRVRAVRRGRLEGFDLVGEFVGFFKVDRASLPALRRAVDEELAASEPGDYERAIDRFLVREGADFVLVGDRPWVEIDFPHDLERAEQIARSLS